MPDDVLINIASPAMIIIPIYMLFKVLVVEIKTPEHER